MEYIEPKIEDQIGRLIRAQESSMTLKDGTRLTPDLAERWLECISSWHMLAVFGLIQAVPQAKDDPAIDRVRAVKEATDTIAGIMEEWRRQQYLRLGRTYPSPDGPQCQAHLSVEGDIVLHDGTD